MQLSTTKRNLGRTAAIVSLLQGLAWAAMALAAIILYNMSPLLDDHDNYTRYIGIELYYRFIEGSNSTSSFIIRPFDFTIFMWIYFILSVGWVAVSIDQLTAIHYNKGRQKKIMFLWGIVTLITSIIDLVFAALLGRDYSSCGEYTDVSESYNCYLVIGIAMSIVARGFTLWLVNVILSFSMLYMSKGANEKEDKLSGWFSNNRLPRVTLSKSTKEDPRRDQSPNFLSNDSPLPSFLYQGNIFGKDDTISSFQGNHDQYEDENKPAPFLSRGEKFGY